MDFLEREFPGSKRDWPFSQKYANICADCGEHYNSPKRAQPCWGCAPNELKNWWASQNVPAGHAHGLKDPPS